MQMAPMLICNISFCWRLQFEAQLEELLHLMPPVAEAVDELIKMCKKCLIRKTIIRIHDIIG